MCWSEKKDMSGSFLFFLLYVGEFLNYFNLNVFSGIMSIYYENKYVLLKYFLEREISVNFYLPITEI